MSDTAPPSGSRLLSAAALVGSATLLSRLTGFIRDIGIAAFLGAGPFAEIFVIAFRLPNLFRRLFAEGAFNAAFVPLFSARMEQDGREAALGFAGRIGAVLVAALIIFTVLAEIFMPQLVYLLAQGFADTPEKFDLAIYYARISFPYLACMSLVSLFSAMLNAKGRFLAAAMAPVLLNLVLLAALGMALWFAGYQARAALDWLIWGVAVAGPVQLIVVAVAAWRAGLRLPFTWPRLSPDVRQMFVLAVPGVLAAGIGQINLLVGTSIATGQQGAAAWLYYADRLYQLPMGVVGVALSVALLPNLSRLLAAGDTTGARASQTLAVLAAMALTLPASVGLYVLAQPVIALLFERGAFSAADTQATALAIKAFCFGLPAFVLIKALQPSFFARRDTRAPLIDGAIGVAVNIGFSLSLFPVYGHVAIALATSLAGWVTLGLMLARLARRGIWQVNWRLARQLAAQLVAALVMGLALNGLMALAGRHGLVINNVTGQIFYVAALVLAGAAIFFALARLLGGVQLSDVESLRKGA